MNIDLINDDALLSRDHYIKCSWKQFCYEYVESHLRMDAALDKMIELPLNSGRYIDAKINMRKWFEIINRMDAYLHSDVPFWMAEDAKEQACQALNERATIRLKA